MNERIKELVKQAGFFVLSNGKIYIPTTSEEITDCQIKFAELIVKECIEELETSKKGDIYTGDLFDCEWNDCINRQIEMLKEEFGVK